MEEESGFRKHKILIAHIIFYLAIAFLILGLSYIVFLLKSEGGQCLKNPLTYAAGSIRVSTSDYDQKQILTPSVQCSCTAGTESICFNKEEVKNCNSGLNISNIFGSNFTIVDN